MAAPQWITHLRDAPSSLMIPPSALMIPPSASRIYTPLDLKHWQEQLAPHPNQELVHFFLEGIAHGFRIGFMAQLNHSAQLEGISKVLSHTLK